MHQRFANPKGVLAELLAMPPDDMPDTWLKDSEIFALVAEYYSPSLEVLRELEDPDKTVLPRLHAIGSTLNPEEYARKIRARITILEEIARKKTGKRFLFWKKGK